MDKKGTALIIGGLYEGLCLSIAIRLAQAGHPICILHRQLTSRNSSEVSSLEVMINRAFSDNKWPLSVVRFDASTASGVAHAAEMANELHTPIDVIVSGEGTNAYPPRDFLEFAEEDWARAVQRELLVDLTLLRTLLPNLRARRRGTIINLGYVAQYWDNHLPFRDGHPLFVNSWPFVLGKTWRKEIVRQIAISEYRYGITINTISPGRVRALTLNELLKIGPTSLDGEITAWHVAEFAFFLSTSAGSAITGADIPILNKPFEYQFKS